MPKANAEKHPSQCGRLIATIFPPGCCFLNPSGRFTPDSCRLAGRNWAALGYKETWDLPARPE